MLDWFERRRTVKVLDWYKPEYNYPISAMSTLVKCNMNSDAPTNEAIRHWHDTVKQNIAMQDKIDLLRYKKQIILQGPPGTGKTYLAQKIAEEMIRDKTIGSSKQKVDAFFEINPTQEQLAKRAEIDGLLTEFREKFPKEGLSSLSLEQYSFGKGDNSSFCYWLEYMLWEAGLYSGQAGKFKIYWKKSISDYQKLGFLSNIQDNNAAMKLLADQLYNIAHETQLEEAIRQLSPGLVLKILHSYHPDTYFPILNDHIINNTLKLLDIDGAGLNIIQKNQEIQKVFLQKKEAFGSSGTNVEFMHYLISNFNLKGTLTLERDTVVSKGKYKIIQFHPAYTYEDLVRGIVTDTDDKNNLVYTVKNKVLMEFAEDAMNNPTSDYILIIDEINRANLPAVFGELIYALEYRGKSVDCLYGLKDDNAEDEDNRELVIPDNLYFIGTMNTADRSIGHIDYAIRRRFAFVDILPEAIPGLTDRGRALFNRVAALFYDGTDMGKPSVYLATDLKPADFMPGHSYFLTKEEERLRTHKTEDELLALRLNFEIKPLLREYLKDGVLSKDAEGLVESLTI